MAGDDGLLDQRLRNVVETTPHLLPHGRRSADRQPVDGPQGAEVKRVVHQLVEVAASDRHRADIGQISLDYQPADAIALAQPQIVADHHGSTILVEGVEVLAVDQQTDAPEQLIKPVSRRDLTALLPEIDALEDRQAIRPWLNAIEARIQMCYQLADELLEQVG